MKRRARSPLRGIDQLHAVGLPTSAGAAHHDRPEADA